MKSLESFFAMGGYAAFVWPAYGLTALVMVWLLVATLRRLRERERALAELQAANPRRRRGDTGGADPRNKTTENAAAEGAG
jgi:heme exporter protein D